MTTITLPRRDLPIAGDLQASGDWYRWARDITERAGGVTGPSTTDLALGAFEDAGIEETKASMFSLADAVGQLPPDHQMPGEEDRQGELSALREDAIALLRRIEALESAPPVETGAFVTLDTPQTLRNKTHVSPVISGGTIDNAVIGGTTPAAGTFTGLTSDSLARNTAGDLTINAANASGNIAFRVAGSEVGRVTSTGWTLTGTLTATGLITGNSATLIKSNTTLSDGAAAATGTLTNAPAAGNPTKWVPINDNGTTRYVPCW